MAQSPCAPALVRPRRASVLAPALALALLTFGCRAPLPAPDASVPDLARELRTQLVAGLSVGATSGIARRLHERDALAAFYARRQYRAAWLTGLRVDAARTSQLVEALRGTRRQGLVPADYHAKEIATLLADEADDPARRAERLAALDLLASDAFLHLARHLAGGVIGPDPPARSHATPIPHAIDALESALRDRVVGATLRRLAPPHPEYAALASALGRLLGAAEARDWPRVPEGPEVGPGERDPGIAVLRARLAWPDAVVAYGDADPLRLDLPLVEALRDFQRRHGLPDDGVLGSHTRDALNVGLLERIDQLRANLERWRWMPRELGSRHVRVNSADQSLRAFASDRPVFDMRVVVGCVGWETPRLHTAITHLLLNPAWNVPSSIAAREMLPAVRRDPNYFTARGIQVLAASARAEPRELDPATIDWDAVPDEAFPFRLRQPPGPTNPLGRIKFAAPNRHAVYLHGSPGRASFDLESRALSHGCVRVEDEVALAGFALGLWVGEGEPEGMRQRLLERLATELEQEVPLPEPLSLHLLYLTASADAAGRASFAADPYGRDPPLIAALRRGAASR